MMISPNPTAAKDIESRVSELASLACSHFLHNQKTATETTTLDSWSNHFRQRVLELSAAVAAGEPALFTSRVLWSRQAMRARYQEPVALGETLHSLRSVISSKLPADSTLEALQCIGQPQCEETGNQHHDDRRNPAR